MSEEAQESSNKYIKKFRQDHARKCERKETMEDLFSRLFISSDPLISTCRKLPKKLCDLCLRKLWNCSSQRALFVKRLKTKNIRKLYVY